MRPSHRSETIAATSDARALERTRGGRYTPAMVTSYNTWLRLSLDFLRSRSLPADAIRYLEVDQLDLTGSTRRFLWFDAPLAPWRPAGQIPGCIAEVVPSYAAWYYAEETGSWIGVDRPRPERPLFIEGRYAMLTPISGPGEKFLFWRGGEANDAGKPDEFWLRDVSLPDGRLL